MAALEFKERRDMTILDLDSMVRDAINQKMTVGQQNRIEKLKIYRENQVNRNKSLGYENRKLRTELKKLDPIKYEKDEKRINQIEKILADPKRTKYPLSIIDNEAKAILKTKKDYAFTVDDGFKPPYKVSIKRLLSSKDMAEIILKKYKEKVKSGITSSDEKIKKETLAKIENCIEYNMQALDIGEYPEGANIEGGEYPINVIVGNDTISLILAGA